MLKQLLSAQHEREVLKSMESPLDHDKLSIKHGSATVTLKRMDSNESSTKRRHRLFRPRADSEHPHRRERAGEGGFLADEMEATAPPLGVSLKLHVI